MVTESAARINTGTALIYYQQSGNTVNPCMGGLLISNAFEGASVIETEDLFERGEGLV